MGSDPGDKLQIIHRLLLGALLAIPVTNFSPGFQEEEALKMGVEIHPVPEGLDGRDDAQKERFPHPLPPFLDPLGVTRGAEAPGPAGEQDEPFLPAVGTPDQNEANFIKVLTFLNNGS